MFSSNTTQVSANAANYIEDVFSTWLTTGAGANITVVNGIDLSGKGGLVWQKTRTSVGYNTLFDTVRGANYYLSSNTTSAQGFASNILPTFNSNGFVIGTDNNLTTSGEAGVSWTFRKQPKFFDIVTYTGNGTIGRTISHNLGSVPGCIIVKRTSTASDWPVYHSGLGATKAALLNLTDAASTWSVWNNTNPTSTVFSVNDAAEVNANGSTYVAYLFASNAGGFGAAGTDNVITCGSFTTDGSGYSPNVTLGYEPQWIMFKRANSATYGSWQIVDTMRGWVNNGGAGDDYTLLANSSNAEGSAADRGYPTATGFNVGYTGAVSSDYIYIAIRRGPMKTPTDATKVFNPQVYTGDSTDNRAITTGFVPDTVWWKSNSNSGNWRDATLLIGANRVMKQNDSTQESYLASYWINSYQNTGYTYGTSDPSYNQSGYTYIADSFVRAPSFHDVVCFTGTGSAITINHNLGVVPEIIITKKRVDNTGTGANGWTVMSSAYSGGFISGGSTNFAQFQSTAAISTGSFLQSTPTATTIPLSGTDYGNTNTFVAYLFATCPGVSKVGSYTGNGTTQTINCGFTGGARFVLIKRTDSSGSWYVYDTARGMTTLTDPYLVLDNTTADTATLGSVTTVSTGFALNATILAAINTNAATYIFLAIA